MNKSILLDFIKRYSLNDTIEKCRWVSNEKEKTLRVSVASETKNLLVDVTLSNWSGFGDAEVGIGNTAKFKRELSGVYGEDVTFVLNNDDSGKKITSIDVLDGENVGRVTTSDLATIAQSSRLKTLPDFNAEIIFDDELVDRFLKAKAALPDVESFTVMMNKKNVLELVVGFSNINSSRYSFKVKTTPGKDTVSSPLHFNAKYLKEILAANDLNSGTSILSVSDSGLATISFTNGDFKCNYYLTPLADQY